MKKFKLKLFLPIIGIVLTTNSSLLAQDTEMNLTTDALDRFETPGAWEIKFSGQRCPTWEKSYINDMAPDQQTKAGEGAQGTDPNKPQQAQTANPQPQAQPQEQGGVDSKENWIRWFSKDQFPVERQSDAFPNALSKEDLEKEKTILGIKSCWISRAFNWVAIEPKAPLYTPDNPVSLSLWVWSPNYAYDVFITVRNEQGYFYNLYMGNLSYFGWRNLKMNIPRYVFPTDKHVSSTKLQIVRIRVVSTPGEDSKGFYAYFDLMQVVHGNQTKTYAGNTLSNNRW